MESQTYCLGCCSCFYSGVLKSGSGMIKDLSAGFCICLYLVGVLFHDFCSLSGFSESMMVAFCLFSWCIHRNQRYGKVDELGERRLEGKDFVIHWRWN